MITAGSLDDPSLYKPTLDIFTASAQPWDHMNPALAKFPKMPPMGDSRAMSQPTVSSCTFTSGISLMYAAPVQFVQLFNRFAPFQIV